MDAREYKEQLKFELDRVFDVDDTFDDSDFFNAVSYLTEEEFTDTAPAPEIVKEVLSFIAEVDGGEMTEAQFVASVYELVS